MLKSQWMHSACYTFQYIISGTSTFYFNKAREAIDPPEVDPKKERIIRINETFSENTKGKMKLFVFLSETEKFRYFSTCFPVRTSSPVDAKRTAAVRKTTQSLLVFLTSKKH